MAKRRKKRKPSGFRRIVLFLMILLAVFWLFPWKQYIDDWSVPRNSYDMDGFSVENGRVSYADETTQSVTGIDVSVHQGEIDWNLVAQDGIAFAIVQAGYRGYSDGLLGEDATYRTNLSGAEAVGLDVGIYFFSQAICVAEAEEEAEFLLELLEGVSPELPVFYDWERVDGGRTQDVNGETVTQCAEVFCEIIEREGYEAGVYFNQDYVYNLIDLGRLTDYPLWFAQYQTQPDCIYDFTWWQYTDVGTVAGITQPVDLNIWFQKQ